MTGMRGGVSYFSCMGEGTRLSHAKFQVSMSIRSQTVVFYKILGVGGRGGGDRAAVSAEKAVFRIRIRSDPGIFTGWNPDPV